MLNAPSHKTLASLSSLRLPLSLSVSLLAVWHAGAASVVVPWACSPDLAHDCGVVRPGSHFWSLTRGSKSGAPLILIIFFVF